MFLCTEDKRSVCGILSVEGALRQNRVLLQDLNSLE